MPRLVAVGLLAATLAADGPSQSAEVRTALGLAQRTQAEEPEKAAALLRRAWLLAAGIEDGSERRLLQGQVADVMRDLDRQGIQAVKSIDRMLQDLRKFANGFSGKGWYDSAETLLRAGELLLPESVADDLRRLEQRRADLAAFAPEPEALPNDLLQEWFRDGQLPYNNTPWKLGDDGLFSPPCEGKGHTSSMMLVCNRRFEGGGRIRFLMKMKAMGRLGFAFALKPNGDRPSYHLFSVFYEKEATEAHTFAIDGIDARHIQTELVPFSVARQRGWLEVEVVLTGITAVLRAGPQKKAMTLHLPEGTDGYLGFYITGDSPCRDPVHLRSLTLERFAPYTR